MMRSRYFLLAMIFTATVCMRIMPYVLGSLGLTDVQQFAGFFWNFSPVTALFLFAGAQFSERRWAYGVPFAAMLISDVVIGLLLRNMSQGLHSMIPAIYASYALIIWSGALLRNLRQRFESQKSDRLNQPLRQRILGELLFLASVTGVGMTGELAFFIVTNFVNWIVQTGYYPHTFDGLMQCYVAGIPFFKNALISTPLYGVVLFGGSALAEAWFPARQQTSSEIATNEQTALA